MASTHVFGATTTSGAGGGDVGIAGSISINIVKLETTATIASGATVNAGAGDVIVEAEADSTMNTTALPAEGGSVSGAESVGIGASVSVALMDEITVASIEGTVIGGDDLAVRATSGNAMTTDSKTGASGGGVSIAPAISIVISNVRTQAWLGAGAALDVDGDVEVKAQQTASALTKARGDTEGGDASIGVALALNIAHHTVEAWSARSITAGGTISVLAFGSSNTKTEAKASAAGAPEEGGDPDAPAGGVDGQVGEQRTHANSTAGAAGNSGGGTDGGGSAETSDGGVSVAAAISVNISFAKSRAWLVNGLVFQAGGALSVRSSANTDGAADADGSAVSTGSGGTAIGAAVSINYVELTNTATTGVTTITSNGLAVEATMTNVSGDAKHVFTVTAKSGAGSEGVGVAGSLALNILVDHTNASVPAVASIAAGSGAVSVTAENKQENTATAEAKAAAGSSSAGVGASVAINVLDKGDTSATVANGATITGGTTFTVSAIATQKVTTTVKAGAKGGPAIAPAVGIAIVLPETIASIGTGAAISASGNVTINASYTSEVKTSGDADAAGTSVAVGAIVAINVVLVKTEATTDRNLSGAAITITSTSTVDARSEVKASAKGESSSGSSADSQSNNQVNGSNSNTNSTGTGTLPSANSQASSGNSQSSGQSGNSGGSVGVAAAVAVNWIEITNKALVAPALTITGTGAVLVGATHEVDATAKATGLAYNISTSSSDALVGAAIGFNYVKLESKGTIGAGSTITGAGVTAEAVTVAGHRNDVISWGLAAAGGNSDTSVAASIGINYVSFDVAATIGANSTITSTGVLGAHASAPVGLQNLAISGAAGTGGAVGAALAVNILIIHTDASIGANTAATATGAITVTAAAGLAAPAVTGVPIVEDALAELNIENSFTSIAASGAAGTGDYAVAGSVIVDVFDLRTRAWIGDNVLINATGPIPGGSSALVSATDASKVVNISGGVAATTGSAGIGMALMVSIIDKDTRAYIGNGVTLRVGGDVSVTTTAGLSFFSLAVSLGGSTSAGIAGSFGILLYGKNILPGTSDGTRASIGGGLASPTTVTAGGSLSVTASAPNSYSVIAGNIAIGSSAGVGVSAAILVVDGIVTATTADHDTLTATSGDATVSATQSEDIKLIAIGGSVGGTAGVAGSAAVNVLSNTTTASIGASTTLTAGDDVTVSASDTTTVLSMAGTLAVGGTAGVGAAADVEVINKTTTASVGAFATITSGGDVTVDALSSEKITSMSVGASFGGTAAVTVNVGVSVINITTNASIGNGSTVNADGSVRVSSDESLKLDVIAGNLSGGGTAAVGAAVAVPIVTKETHAFIGDNATVNAKGQTGVSVKTGGYTVTTTDTRFKQAAVSGNTIDLGYTHNFSDGQEVLYDNGGGSSIGGLTDGSVYYVHAPGTQTVQLKNAAGTTITLSGGGTGENHRLIPTNQAGVRDDESPRLDPATARSDNTITLPYTLKQNGTPVALAEDDAVVYSSGGGDPIGGLVDGQTYYVHLMGGSSIQLRNAKTSDGGTIVPLTSDGTGRGHSIVLSGMQPSGDPSGYGPRQIAASSTGGFRGVGVTATNSDDLAMVGISAGVGGTAAVNVAGAIDVSNINTSAYIGKNGQINCGLTCATNVTGADAAQSVRVAAANQFYELGIAGSLAIGGTAGVAVPVGVRVVHINADAFIDNNTKVNARNDISVTATAKDTVLSVVVGAGGGTVGVAGSVGVTLITLHTFASTGSFVQLNADGDVLVAASDDTKLQLIQIGLAGGFVGVGAAVGVAKLDKDTQAFIGSNNTINGKGNGSGLAGIRNGAYLGSGFGTLVEFHGVAVQASSSENVFGLTASVGGGFVGVAGGVGVTLIGLVTKALIGTNTSVNATVSGTSASQSVNVAAVDRAKTLTVAGGVGGGFVGVAAGVDIGTLDMTVQTAIGTGATVRANDEIAVYALSRKDMQTYALSVGGGFVGVAASVTVWSVGEQSTTTYQDDGGGSKGDWSSGTKYGEGDVVTIAGSPTKYRAVATTDDARLTQDPTGNTADWDVIETKQALSTTGSNAASDSDDVAKGGGGYKDAVNGASVRDAGPWSSGATYKQGDVVTFSSSKYVARKTTSSLSDPSVNTADWNPYESSAAADKTNQRMNGGFSSASSGLTAAAPSTGPTGTATGGSRPLALGTVIQVNGALIAGGDVQIRALDDITAQSLAGSIAAGAVGVGASISILSVKSHTEAQVSSTGSVSAGPGIADSVEVTAAATENTNALALGGAVGAGAFGGQVVVLKSNVDQYAHIDSGATIPQAGGGVSVNGTATRVVKSLSVGAGLGAVAAGLSMSLNTTSGDTKAQIGNVAVGTDVPGGGPVRGIAVAATANVAPTATSYSVQVGGGGALSGSVAVVTLSGLTRAASGAHGPLGDGGYSVVATGVHGGTDARTFNVAVGAGISLGVTVAITKDERDTEAAITGGSTSTTGAVNVTADATNTTFAHAPSVTGGSASLSVMLPTARVAGHTSAQVDGTITASSSITVHATALLRAKAQVTMGSVSLVGLAGAYADAQITSGAYIEASVGPSASLASGGAVQVIADLKSAPTFFPETDLQRLLGQNGTTVVARNEAIAIADSIAAAGFAAAGIFAARAELGGAVRAELDGDVTGSGSVLVKAEGGNYVDARTLTISVGGLAGFGASLQIAEVSSSADVEATSSDGNNDQQITSSGKVEFIAHSNNDAVVHTLLAAGGSVAGIAVTVPTARVEGGTTASVEGNVTAGSAGVKVEATSGNSAKVTIFALGIGALAAAVTWGEAEISSAAVTDAKVLANASVSAPGGAVEVLATSINHVNSQAKSLAAGALAVNVMRSVATVAGRTLASFDGDIPSTLTKTASLTVRARGQNQATVDAFIAAISLTLSGGVNLASAQVTSAASTAAEILGNSTITVLGGVTVDAGLTTDGDASDVVGGAVVARAVHFQNYALANLSNVAGGAIAVGATLSDAKVDGGVRATLNGDINGSGFVTVTANGTNTVLSKTLFVAAGLAGLSYTDTTAEIGDNADVQAQVGSSATVASSGLISVTSGSTNTATINTNGGAFGLVAASATLPRAKVRGATLATFAGNATSGSGLTVTSTSNNDTTVTVSVISIGAFAGALTSAYARITDEADTDASVTGPANVGAGTVAITSTSDNDATASINGVTGAAIALGITLPTAEAFGETRAYAGQGANITAGTVNITAFGSTSATATTTATSISAIGGGFLEADANAGGIIDAFIGQPATSGASTGTTFVHVGSGAITISADGDIDATATANGVSGALLSISDFKPRATASAAIRAYVRDNVDVIAGSMNVRAGQASDKVTLDATATSNVVSVSLAGGGGVVPTARTTGSAEAFLGAPGGVTGVNTVATKIDVSGTISVAAYSDLHATARADGVAVAGVAANIQDASATAGGVTRAYAGDGADIEAGLLTLNANSMLHADATTKGVSVGLGSLSGVEATATVSSVTEAYLGKSADSVAAGTILVDLDGPTTMNATSDGTANATARGANIGLAAIGLLYPTALANGVTRTYIGPDTDLSASSVTGVADATMRANAKTTVTAIGGIAATDVSVLSDIQADTSAFIGTNADVTATGAVSLSAIAHNTSTALTDALSAGAIGISLYDLDAKTTSRTAAFVGDRAHVTVGSLTLSAESFDTPVVAFDFTGISGFSGGSTTLDAVNTATVETYIGPAATLSGSSGDRTQVTATGAGGITMTATSHADVDVLMELLSLSLLGSVGASSTTARSNATVRSFIGDYAIVDSGPGSLLVSALSDPDVRARGRGFSAAGGFTASGGTATAEASGSVRAYTKDHATLSGNAMTFQAQFTPSGNRTLASMTIGGVALLAGIAGGEATATSTPTVESYIAANTTVDIDGTLTVTAASSQTATAISSGSGGGLVGVGAAKSTANADGTINAYVAGDIIGPAAAAGANSVSISASSANSASADSQAVAGGLVAFSTNSANAHANPTIRAYVAGTTQLVATSNLHISASALPEADAASRGVSGGLIGVGGSESTASASPTVEAYIGTGASITVGGNIEILASSDIQTPGGQGPTYIIESVDTTNDRLHVGQHGLNTGDTIEYDNSNGNPDACSTTTPIAQLTSAQCALDDDGNTFILRRAYNVLGSTADDLSLGSQFNGTSCTGSETSCVNTVKDTILFGSAHNLLSGDRVVYAKPTGGSTIGGLNLTSTAYFVLVLDERTIRLVATQSQALSPAAFVKSVPVNNLPTSGISGTTITLAGHGFANGQAVTYRSPTPLGFTAGQVDLPNGSAGSIADLTDVAGNNNLVFVDTTPDGVNEGKAIAHNFSEGDKIVYNATSGDALSPAVIGGLVDGGIYRVHVINSSTIQL